MDGNRRWARAHGLPVAVGYRCGLSALRRTLRAARDAGVRVVTAYAFSEENWQRPRAEVDLLMRLCFRAAYGELLRIAREGVRVRLCGKIDRLPPAVAVALRRLARESAANPGVTLNLAVNYGARHEIGDAMRSLAREVMNGQRELESIDDDAIGKHLYTAGLPDPDLIVRTGGELRISNFLLFQAAYAEFWSTSTYWPDFGDAEFKAALENYALRQRRYGT